MDEYSKDKNIQYQKSKSGFQCLGPCYKPGTVIIHPLALEYVTDNQDPFCPVKEWIHKLPNGSTVTQNTDICHNPTNDKNISKKELEMNMLIPYIDFNCEQFLKIYYNIYSFGDAMNWLEKNEYTPTDNKLRIVDCSFSVYGANIDVIDYRITFFIIDLIKKKWINNLYNKLNKYIGIKDNLIFFIQPNKNKLQSNEYTVQRINFLLTTFATQDEVLKFLEKYFRYRHDIWDTLSSHIEKIREDFGDYIQEKITQTLSKS